jgi:hypothetical protein
MTLTKEELIRYFEIKKQYQKRAQAEKQAGSYISISMIDESIFIHRSDESEYHLKYDEADKIRKEYQDVKSWLTITFEEFVLAQITEW